MIENRHSSDIFIEKLYENTITINSSTNQSGIVSKDDNSNYIADYLTGSRKVYKAVATSLNSMSGILIYDSKNWSYAKGSYDIVNKTTLSNLYNGIVLKDTETTYYKFDAFKGESNDFSGASTTIPSVASVNPAFTETTHTIFKVFLNNEETTDYTVSSGAITFTTGYKLFNNYCTVLFYNTTQSIGSQSIVLYFKGAYKSLMTASEYYNGIPFTTNADILSGNLAASSYYYVRNAGTGFLYAGTTYATGSIITSGAGGAPTWNGATLVLLPTIAVSGGNAYEVTLTGATNAKLSLGMTVKIGSVTTTIVGFSSTTIFYVNDAVSTPTQPYLNIFRGLGYNTVDDDWSIENNSEYFDFDVKGTKTPFRKKIKQRKSVTFTQWIDENYSSTLQSYPCISRAFYEYFTNDDLFRIYFVNKYDNKVEILTNAKIYDDPSKSYASDGNKVTTNIVFEDMISTVDKNVTYGSGVYGVGYYGGYKIIRS